MGLNQTYNKYDIKGGGGGKARSHCALWILSQCNTKTGPRHQTSAFVLASCRSHIRTTPFVPPDSSVDYTRQGSGSCFPDWRHCSGNRLGCHGDGSPGPGPALFQAASLSACTGCNYQVTPRFPGSSHPAQHGKGSGSSNPDGL